jgi:hypothetical protein
MLFNLFGQGARTDLGVFNLVSQITHENLIFPVLGLDKFIEKEVF